MATSNSVNLTYDRDTIIRMGCEIAGIATEGEPLDTSVIAVLARHLNVSLKHWAVLGFHLWKRERQAITLVASQHSYTLGQKAAGTATSTVASELRDTGANFVTDVAVGDTVNNTTDSTSTTVLSVDSTTALTLAADIFVSGENYEITTADESFPRPDRILECNRKTTSDGTEVTVTELSMEEYENLPNKTTTGTPVQFFYDPTLTNGTFYVWPAPDSTAASDFTIDIVAQTQVHDMDSGTDDFDFPQEWYQPIVDRIAYVATKIYGSARLGELAILKQDAQESLDDAANFDQDNTSVFFSPDYERQG